MKKGIIFKVVAVSSNTNSFGLHQAIMISREGVAYKACAGYLNVPKRGDELFIPFIGEDSNSLDFGGRFEIPERIEDAPQDVIAEVWGQ